MYNELNENTSNNVALYNVRYVFNVEEERSIVLLLKTGRKNKKRIRRMIALITRERPSSIKILKCGFKKKILGYTDGLDGTLRCNELMNLKDIQALQAKKDKISNDIVLQYDNHKKKHPFKPNSKKSSFNKRIVY